MAVWGYAQTAENWVGVQGFATRKAYSNTLFMLTFNEFSEYKGTPDTDCHSMN